MATLQGRKAITATAASSRSAPKIPSESASAPMQKESRNSTAEKSGRKPKSKVAMKAVEESKRKRGRVSRAALLELVTDNQKPVGTARGRINKQSDKAAGSKRNKTESSTTPTLPKGAPPPETVMNEELKSEGLEYEVEKVVDSRLDSQGNREYLVKWVGWKSNHNTWEPEAHLHNAFDKITQFDSKHPEAV